MDVIIDHQLNRATGKLDGIAKIAVLRSNAIGDFVFALPALASLRAAYPHAEIVLLALPWHRDFLRDRPGPIDRVEIVPRVPGVRNDLEALGVFDDEATVDAFFARMRAESFDLALQLHGGGHNSNPFVLRLGARHTAGSKTADALPLERWVPYVYWQSEIIRLLEVVRLVGGSTIDLEPKLDVTEEDLEESCAVVPESSLPLVVLHPSASDGRRRWPPEKFAAVGDILAGRGLQVAVAGVPGERELVDRVLGAMQAPAIDLCGRLSLRGMAGTLARSTLVVGNDSGIVHLAEAVGTPTVAVYWCGNLITGGPPMRSRHRVHLSWRLDCLVCGRNCIYDNCEHHQSFVSDVPVEEVAGSALEILAPS